MFVFAHQVHIAVSAFTVPADILKVTHTLQGHGDAFQTVGDLNRNRVQLNAARLLEVGELGDLLPVQPDFPAQAPGAQGGAFPVILYKTNIVAARVNANRFQRAEVKLLRVAGIGLEDHLELGMLLQAVGIIAVTAVIRAYRRLNIGHVPGLRPQHPQHGGRVHGTRAHLGIIGLPDQAALICPETLQAEDHGLKVERLVHTVSQKIIFDMQTTGELYHPGWRIAPCSLPHRPAAAKITPLSYGL